MLSTLDIAGHQLGFGNGFPSDNFDYAMAAGRLGKPDLAAEILMASAKDNVYNPKNGFWQGWYPAFTPTNGQLLYAVALLVAGWDGNDINRTAPGLPVDGWVVRSEGLKRLP